MAERTNQIPGFLEVDHDRGVIYFHSTDPETMEKVGAITVLRICRLPAPIPDDQLLDITHMHGVNWSAPITVFPAGTPMEQIWDHIDNALNLKPEDR